MGIPVDILPITSDGVLHTENHQEWIQFRVGQEQKYGLPPTLLKTILAGTGIALDNNSNNENKNNSDNTMET